MLKKSSFSRKKIIVLVLIIGSIIFINLPIVEKYETFNCIRAPCPVPMTSIYGKYLGVANFDQCVDAGNPVMESYPRQCSSLGRTFVEDVITIPDCNLGPC